MPLVKALDGQRVPVVVRSIKEKVRQSVGLRRTRRQAGAIQAQTLGQGRAHGIHIEPLAFDGGGVHGVLQQSVHLGLQTFLTGNALNAAQQSTL